MYGKKVKLRAIFILSIFFSLILIVFLVFKSLEENVVYFKSPTEIKNLTELTSKKIRVGCMVKEKSIKVNQSEVSVDNLKVLENIEVKLTVEVGSSQLKIRDLLRLNEGSVVELERLAGDPLDILANGVQIARGEVVMVGERFGVRFTEVSNPQDTVKKL